ncbi:MAG: ribonuclease III [Janthinobacterium lividum]
MNTDIEALQKNIGYNFNNIDLLVQSLSHPSLRQYRSAMNEVEIDNERLELLGDSIIGFIITEIIFKKYLDCSEGKLATIRSHLICKDTLCKVAKNIDLASYIIMTCGEEISGGRTNPNNLENAMEALIAAIYLDSDMSCTKFVVQKLWSNFLQSTNLTEADPKSALQEFVQKFGHSRPIYEIKDKSGPAHAPIFIVLVKALDHYQIGEGNSLKAAEKIAAKKLLKLLQHHNSHL